MNEFGRLRPPETRQVKRTFESKHTFLALPTDTSEHKIIAVLLCVISGWILVDRISEPNSK